MVGLGHLGHAYEVTDIPHARKLQASQSDSVAHEFAAIQSLRDAQRHFPCVIAPGTTADHMELLGPAILDVRRACPGGRFSQSTAVKFALEVLSCIEAAHRHSLVHRDIKPSNFAFRVPESERLVLLDFGLAKRIFDAATQRHFRDSVSHGTVGTGRYQSFRGPQGQQISRRDDLISWAYTIVEMADGRLPSPGRSHKEGTFRAKLAIRQESIFMHFCNCVALLHFFDQRTIHNIHRFAQIHSSAFPKFKA
jgi:serine/threonine protein kinase